MIGGVPLHARARARQLRQGGGGARRLCRRPPARRAAGRADGGRRPPLSRASSPPTGCVLGSVVTFAGLAREIARAGRIRRAPRLSDAPARAGAGNACSPRSRFDVARRLGDVGRVRRPAAGELIAELERELVTPQRFVAGAARVVGPGPAPTRPTPRDLGAHLPHYVRELERLGSRRPSSCTRGRRSTRCAPPPGIAGARRGVLLRLRRAHCARARRGRDARRGSSAPT